MEEEARRKCAHADAAVVNNPPPPHSLGSLSKHLPINPTPSIVIHSDTTTARSLITACRRTCDRDTSELAMKEKIKLYLGLFRAAPAPKIQADFGILPRAFHRQMSIHSRVLPSMLWSTQREGRCDQSHWGWACLFCFFWEGGGPYNTCSLPGMPTDTV